MASVSGATSSLGNTSLRGFGGLASGIDRDEMIEAMTSGTQAKIDRQKGEMTKLQWKQEAYRSVIDKVLNLEDGYFSYFSGSNLKAASLFAKSIVTAIGDDDVTKFIKASGTSAWVDNLAIQAVDQLATSATRMSNKMPSDSVIQTGIKNLDDNVTESKLSGKTLIFGTAGLTADNEMTFNTVATFTFPTSYTETVDGQRVTREIDYTAAPEELVAELNKAMENSSFELGKGGKLEFGLDENDKITVKVVGDKSGKTYAISKNSTALAGLGFDKDQFSEEDLKDGIDLATEFQTGLTTAFKDSYTTSERTMKQYLTGKKISVSYGGQTKTINLIEEDDQVDTMDDLKNLLQERLNKAFGENKVEVDYNSTDGLFFKSSPRKDADGNVVAGEAAQPLTINAEGADMRKIIGIEKNASNKLNLDSSLWYNREKLGFSGYGADKKERFEEDLKTNGFKINGTEIKGITAETTVNELINRINANKDAGVKASYLSGSNQFLLVASETGSGRKITLEGAASNIFGGADADNKDGLDATIRVSYGNGVSQTLTSATNTFDLEGMKVTVSGLFGYASEADKAAGKLDSSQEVTFSAKADVDKTTEKVKEFFKAYNAIVEEVNSHVTTRPDKSYGPLTDAQKEEMDEKSIENWEKKAKEGILFSDSAMKDFNVSLQNVMVTLMNNGISYSDLESIGITMSDDAKDGGKIVFDENKFKSAMENDAELVSNIFTGGGNVKKGLASIIEDTLTPYATKYRSDNAATADSNGSYGRLVEEAGSEKVPLSVSNNWIYQQLQEMEKTIATLKSRLKTEQDSYIRQFTTMESMINKFNTQSGYLSQLQG